MCKRSLVCAWFTLVLLYTLYKDVHGFYNIAHMTNTKHAVDWALGHGANGVEIDLQFSSSGSPTMFNHSPRGELCDCSCMCFLKIRGTCSTFWPKSVCAQLENHVPKGHSACRASTGTVSLLNHLARKSRLALVIIDSKIDGKKMSRSAQRNAARRVVRLLQQDLFAKGYKGKVIIGAEIIHAFSYIREAAVQGTRLTVRRRIFYTFDGERNNVPRVLNQLKMLPGTKNRVFNTGITACAPAVFGLGIRDKTYKLAAINKAKGVVGLSYLWTIDRESSMKTAIRYFDGIITNYPGKLRAVLHKAGVKLATPHSRIPSATSSHVISRVTRYTCDCTYSFRGGCYIKRSAPPGLACYCKYKFIWRCSGSVVACRDPNSYHCKHPSRSVHSCVQGFGDCGGYKRGNCDCSYRSGGCVISRIAPRNTACKCIYKFPWRCSGMVTRCHNPTSRHCTRPNKSIQSCVQGGGDCGGYKTGSCDCKYRPGGCSISRPAPANHACKCVYKVFWRCGGEVTNCRNGGSRFCTRPDTSVHSCFQGQGDCQGYKTARCDCRYRSGGCVINKVPPRNTACKCRYRFLWSCSGSVVKCNNFSSRYCKQPDKSRATCQVGGGDCGGYRG